MYVNDVELKDGEWIAPGIKIIPNAIDNPRELIDIANSVPEGWNHSPLGAAGETDHDVRRSNSFPIPVHFNNPLSFFTVAQKIYLYAQQYAGETHMSFSHMESISMLEYLADDGFYLPHLDYAPEFPRIISALLYLNDVDEGGDTYFDNFDLSVSPTEGTLILFPSGFPYTHEARNPVSGNKYVLVTWFGQALTPEIFQNYYGRVQ